MKKYPPTKDRRDIGQVTPFIEKMDSYRELSSCCVGVEAAMETNKNMDNHLKRLADRLMGVKKG
jgi:hypothetical protein